LRVLDLIIILVYLARVVGIGFAVRKKQTTTDEYFRASSSMGWLIVGISIVGSSTSTLSYLSFPGEIIAHGPALLLANLVFPISYLVISRRFLPTYLRYNVTTIFEYLERRFDLPVRMLGTVVFFLTRVARLSFIVFTASLAVSSILSLPLPTIVAAVGLLATLYTTLGGIRADIIADTWETAVLFLGGITTIVVAVILMNGPTSVVRVIVQQRHLNIPLLSMEGTSVVGVLLWAFVLDVYVFGSDQSMVQRIFCTRTLSDARKGMLLNFVGSFVFETILALIGFSLFAYFTAHPEPQVSYLGKGLERHADMMFPFFIAHVMPAGASGLIVASLLAAAMSSLDSGINSSVTVLQIDILDRFGVLRDPKATVAFAKKMSVLFGILATIGAWLIPMMKGNLLQVTASVGGLFEGPVMALFLLAVCTKSVERNGAYAGVIGGILAGIAVAYSNKFFGTPRPSFTWIAPAGAATTALIGWAVSQTYHRRKPLQGVRP
jgi:solute:Na+ symporter, SSS family